MKATLYSAVLFFLITLNATAQTLNTDAPYIEVTGTSEMEVVPDMIYLKIVLGEKNSGTKSKISIEAQEDNLKNALKEINVDLSKLSLSDASSNYINVTWGKDNVLTRKEYTLLIDNAETLSKVLEQLDRLKVSNAYINKVDHSEILSLKQQVRINAIQAAKAKADYLLGAIGSTTGKPLIIREQQFNIIHSKNEMIRMRGARSGYANTYVEGVKIEDKNTSIQFEKIKLEYSIYAKFEIK